MKRLALLLMPLALALGQTPTLRVDVQLSQIVVTVTDAQGRHITNLKAGDFALELDGEPQPIAHFSQDSEAPVALGLVMDMSGSMRASLGAARKAGATFIRGLGPRDEFLLAAFSDSFKVWQPLTRDKEKLIREFESVHPMAMGGTDLLNSVIKAEQLLLKSSNKKRALVLITDGLESKCSLSSEAFAAKLVRAGVVVYGIRMPLNVMGVTTLSPLILNSSRACLKAPSTMAFFNILETATGSRTFELKPEARSLDADLEAIFSQISVELRAQYTLGFYPVTKRESAIRVRTTHPEYQVRTQQKAVPK